MPPVGERCKAEACRVDSGAVDRVACGDSRCQGHHRGIAKRCHAHVGWCRMPFDLRVSQERKDRQHIVHAADDRCIVVAVGVAGILTRVLHLSLLQTTILLASIAGMVEIGSHDRGAGVEQLLDLVARADGGRVAARVVEPDHDLAVPVAGIEPGDWHLLAVGRVAEHTGHSHETHVAVLAVELPAHAACRGERTVEDRFKGGPQHASHARLRRRRLADLAFDVCGKAGHERPLKLSICRRRCGMLVAPDCQLLRRERLVVVLEDRLWEAEAEVPVEECLEGGAGDSVVVVGKVFTPQEHHPVAGPKQVVDLLNVGEALGGKFFRPVIRGVHALRLGCEDRRQLDVAGAHAKQPGVFTGAAALH